MAKSKKALKALRRRKEAKKRSRVVKDRQDYRSGGRVKAFEGANIDLGAAPENTLRTDLREAEAARQAREAEATRQAQEAQEAEAARQAQEAEAARQAQEAEAARQAQEAEAARQAQAQQAAEPVTDVGTYRVGQEADPNLQPFYTSPDSALANSLSEIQKMNELGRRVVVTNPNFRSRDDWGQRAPAGSFLFDSFVRGIGPNYMVKDPQGNLSLVPTLEEAQRVSGSQTPFTGAAEAAPVEEEAAEAVKGFDGSNYPNAAAAEEANARLLEESPFDYSHLNIPLDSKFGEEVRYIRINDGTGSRRVVVPWKDLTTAQQQRLVTIYNTYPEPHQETDRAKAAYSYLTDLFSFKEEEEAVEEEEEERPEAVAAARTAYEEPEPSDETEEEIDNPYVETRELKGLAHPQVENATGDFKAHLDKWGLKGGYTNTFGLFDHQELKLYWRNFRGWEQRNPAPPRYIASSGAPTDMLAGVGGAGGVTATGPNKPNPKWGQWNTRRLFAHNDIVAEILRLPRYGGIEGAEGSRYGQIKPVRPEQFKEGTTVPYKIPGLAVDDVDTADVATVIDPETGEPSDEDTEAETFEIDRDEIAEVAEPDQVTTTDISITSGTAEQILKTKAEELGVTAPTVEAYTSAAANYFLRYPHAKKAVEQGLYPDFISYHANVGKARGYDIGFDSTQFAEGEVSKLGEAFRATLTETQAAERDVEAEQEALAETVEFEEDTRSQVDPVTGEIVQLAATPDAERQQRKAITDEEPAQGTEAIISGFIGYDAAQKRQVTGTAAKGAAKSLLEQVGEIPADISEAILDDPAVVTAQVDTQPVEVQAAIAALPPEALVSVQLENLLAGIDEGKTPVWARPAVQLVESNLAARGLSVSTVGRDALFNSIIQSAIPLAQNNATALQQRAAQNLSNQQQANLQQASQEMQLRLTNLANRQSSESQSAQLAQQINLTQGQFIQQAALTESEQFQQARMASLQNEQQAAMVNLGNDQQMEMANLQVEAERLGANQSALNQERLAEMQVAANFLEKNAGFKQQMELANISNEQQMRLAFLSAKNQAESENLSAAQQTELANLNKRLEVNKRNAELAQQMGLAQLNVDQQRAMQNAATVANIDMTKFNAAQQIELANSKFMQTATLQDLNNRQQAIMQDATTLASMDLAAADAKTKVSIENARNFLAMDMANLTNEQQAYMLDSQQKQQRLLSDISIENAARQFNATTDLQTQQYVTSLAAQLQQFNVQQANAMEQFNVSEANKAAAIDAGNALAADQFNAQIQTQIRQFNSQQDLQVEQFNTANSQAVEQSNVEWRRKANLADTAATNVANQQQAAFQFDLNKTALSQAWQSLRDQANFDFTEYQSDKERKISAINALLGNEAFMTEEKYNNQRNRLLYLMDEFGDSLEISRDVDVLEIPAELTA